jgi:TRAP-type uncharacterized transport system substrate-binding protein
LIAKPENPVKTDGEFVDNGAPGRLGRRALLRSALVLMAVIATMGHSPYRQWKIYRKRNLLILTSRSDAPSFPLGERVAQVLAKHLPESRAQVSRAPTTERIASLISTKQMDVAVLSLNDAATLLAGRAPFTDYGPVPLRTIVVLGDYLLICREDFPALHAYLLAETLMKNRDELDVTVSSPDTGNISAEGVVPAHRGARAYVDGRPPPDD